MLSSKVRPQSVCIVLDHSLAAELLPYLEPEMGAQAQGRRKPRAEQDGGDKGKGQNTLLDQFVKKSATDESQSGQPAMTIVMNEDGTMMSVPVEPPS